MLRIKLSAIFAIVPTIMMLCVTSATQSGGTFSISQSVIGGGGPSSGGTFMLNGTNQQAVAGGPAIGSSFHTTHGFWNFAPSGPSASVVNIRGRVLNFAGIGIRNVGVQLTESNGITRNALTGSLGYYSIDNVEVGQTVVISVSAKRFVFANSTRIVTVQDELAEIDFTAEP